jgi:hypothetical protein
MRPAAAVFVGISLAGFVARHGGDVADPWTETDRHHGRT